MLWGHAQRCPVPFPGTKTLSGSVATMDACVRHFLEATGKRASPTSCSFLCRFGKSKTSSQLSAQPGNVPSCPRREEKGWHQWHSPQR